MSNQLSLFEESRKRQYKAFYDDFYKGVAERYQNSLRDKQINKHERISILINKEKDVRNKAQSI